MSSCDQFRELYEAYALGALDAPEREAFEAHLATGCLTCANGVAEARWVVSQLAYAAGDASPSELLKARLMQTVRGDAKSTVASPSRSSDAGDSSSKASRSESRIPYWFTAGIAALVLIAFYYAWSAQRTTEQLRAENERLQTEQAAAKKQVDDMQSQLASLRRETAILSDPAMVKVRLMPQKIEAPELMAMCGKNGIILSGQKVPMPTGNRVLQLWLIPKTPGAKPMPSGTLRPDDQGWVRMVAAHPGDVVPDIKALAITEEPAGGSEQPTSAIRWMGAIS